MQRSEVVDLNRFRDVDNDGKSQNEVAPHILPAGTRLLLGQYTIEGYLNCGGFGITYVAHDSLRRKIVIKECFPSEMVYRRGKAMVSRNSKYDEELAGIVSQFVTEAHNLANVRHENVVHVHQIFEENDTAYMAMDFIKGPDLLDLLDSDRRLSARDVQKLTFTMLRAIAHVHASGMLHRDISPDNILIGPNGTPILIDFGAARQHVQKAQRKLSRMKFVKDGYSPQEFYIVGSAQGQSSDLYSFAASIYHLISGAAPIDAQTRLAALANKKGDPYVPLVGTVDVYPQRFLRAVDDALSFLPEDRIQSAEKWLEQITPRKSRVVTAMSRQAAAMLESLAAIEANAMIEDRTSQSNGKLKLAAGVCVLALLGGGGYWMFGQPPLPSERLEASVTTSAPLLVAATTSPDASVDVATWPSIELRLAQLPRLAFAPIADPLPALESTPPARIFETTLFLVGLREQEPITLAALSEDRNEGPGVQRMMAELSARPDTPNPLPDVSPGTTPDIRQRSVDATARAFQERQDNTSGTRTSDDALQRFTDASVLAARKQPDMPLTPVRAPFPPRDLALAAVAPTAFDPLNVTLPPLSTSAPVGSFSSLLGVVDESTAPVVRLGDNPLNTRVSHSHWDVHVPFTATPAKRQGAHAFEISDADASRTAFNAEWLADGAVLFAFNGQRIDPDATLAEHFLGALSIQDNGFATAMVRVKNADTGALERVELAVPAVRKTRLADGTLLVTTVDNGSWVTTVQSLGFASTDLQIGDVISENSGNGTRLTDPASVERAFNALVQGRAEGAEFSIIRNGQKLSAAWTLPGG